jgi:hypothetical protein
MDARQQAQATRLRQLLDTPGSDPSPIAISNSLACNCISLPVKAIDEMDGG